MVFDFTSAAQGLPPLVVNVNVANPENPAGGVQVAFKVVALGLNVPPAGLDQVPPVAEPPTEPPNGAEVPPWHIAVKAAPASVVGGATIVKVFEEVAFPQGELPVAVKVSVTLPAVISAALGV
jgi:hypothetical protein